MSTDEMIKLVVLGNGGVGKSALTVQFVQRLYVEKYDPTIEDSYRKIVSVDDKMVTLEVLDTAGTDQFTAMRDMYMKSGQGFVLVFSLISRSGFDAISDIYEKILRVKERSQVPTILVGNKCDVAYQRIVVTSEAENLAKKLGCDYLEASAKHDINVDKIFLSLAKQVLSERDSLQMKGGKKKTKKGGKGTCSIL